MTDRIFDDDILAWLTEALRPATVTPAIEDPAGYRMPAVAVAVSIGDPPRLLRHAVRAPNMRVDTRWTRREQVVFAGEAHDKLRFWLEEKGAPMAPRLGLASLHRLLLEE